MGFKFTKMPTIQQVLSFIQTLFPGQLLLNSSQLAQLLGRSEKSLQHLIDRGSLPFDLKKIGGRWSADIFRVAEWLVREEPLVSQTSHAEAEKPTKPTRPTRVRVTPGLSERKSLGGKLLQMRHGAAAAMRCSLGTLTDPSQSEFIEQFVSALLQPSMDDEITVDARLSLEGAGGVSSEEALHQVFFRLGDAAEAVADLQMKKPVHGQINVSRAGQEIFACGRQPQQMDWGVTTDADARFTAMLGFVLHQASMTDVAVSDFSDKRVPDGWL